MRVGNGRNKSVVRGGMCAYRGLQYMLYLMSILGFSFSQEVHQFCLPKSLQAFTVNKFSKQGEIMVF